MTLRQVPVKTLLALGVVLALATCKPRENGNPFTAFFRLTLSEKIAYLNNSNQWAYTTKINSAAVCLAHYGHLNPKVDAEAEARSMRPRFYYNFFDGFAAGFMPTAMGRDCDPSESLGDPRLRYWQPINQYDSVAGDVSLHFEVMARCNAAAHQYASSFNKRLAELRPDRRALACKKPAPSSGR